MSQAEFLRSFDAMAFGAFGGAGLADAATYLPLGSGPGDAPAECLVLVDRNVEDFGNDLAPVSTLRTRVTFQRADVEPVEGGAVTVGSETFILVQRTRADESVSAWWVQHG